jgi:1-acyl-sn-glycerol-3-phosphate acyltransferase
MFKRDITGTLVFVKKFMIFLIGVVTYPILKWLNNTRFEGQNLIPAGRLSNILFVSNHQTYFIDVMVLYTAVITRGPDASSALKWPWYIFRPSDNIYYVAAQETMRSGVVAKLLEMAGSVSIERTWRQAGEDVRKQVKLTEISSIGKALSSGWVITFPQGTTTPFVPGRRGTAHLIKKFKPVVIPVVIDGVNQAFHRKSVTIKKTGVEISVRFKEPLNIDYDDSPQDILAQIMDSIEQSERFRDASSAEDGLTKEETKQSDNSANE